MRISDWSSDVCSSDLARVNDVSAQGIESIFGPCGTLLDRCFPAGEHRFYFGDLERIKPVFDVFGLHGPGEHIEGGGDDRYPRRHDPVHYKTRVEDGVERRVDQFRLHISPVPAFLGWRVTQLAINGLNGHL